MVPKTSSINFLQNCEVWSCFCVSLPGLWISICVKKGPGISMETGSNQHPRGASKCDDTHCEYSPADFREERWVFVEKELGLDVFWWCFTRPFWWIFWGLVVKLEVVNFWRVGKMAEALYQLVAQILFVLDSVVFCWWCQARRFFLFWEHTQGAKRFREVGGDCELHDLPSFQVSSDQGTLVSCCI